MKQFNDTASSEKGFYKLSWLQRIGFGSGDLAQNLIFQTVSLLVGEIGDEQRQTRTNGKTATVGHEHANGGENRDLVGVASQG